MPGKETVAPSDTGIMVRSPDFEKRAIYSQFEIRAGSAETKDLYKETVAPSDTGIMVRSPTL